MKSIKEKKKNIKWTKFRIFKWSILIFPVLLILAKVIAIVIEKTDPTECIPEFCVSPSGMFFGFSLYIISIIFIPYLIIYIIILLIAYLKKKKIKN